MSSSKKPTVHSRRSKRVRSGGRFGPAFEPSYPFFVLPRFPFAIPYVVTDEEIVIVAVAHVSRRPLYWLKRIPR